MNNNDIQRYTSILLGKENVETISDLQLLFSLYDVHISRRFDAVENGKHMLYRREDLTQLAKEAFERGEKYFYCKPVDEKNPYGPLVLCEPEYKYRLLRPLTEEEYNNVFQNIEKNNL